MYLSPKALTKLFFPTKTVLQTEREYFDFVNLMTINLGQKLPFIL